MTEVNYSDFEKIKAMPFYQFRRWLEEYFEDCGLKDQAYKEGYDEGIDDYETEHEDDFNNGKTEGIEETSEEIFFAIAKIFHRFRHVKAEVAIYKIIEEIESLADKYHALCEIRKEGDYEEY